MHGTIQTMIMDMLKKAKVWAIREPQHMFHGLVPTEYLRRYCEEQRTTKDFIIPDIMTQDHPCKQRNGKQKRIYEIKTMRVDFATNESFSPFSISLVILLVVEPRSILP